MSEQLTQITIVDKAIYQLQPGEMTYEALVQHCWFIGCPGPGCKGFSNLGGHTVVKEGEVITISPSILCGCGAHYFVEQNQIRWV